MTSCAVDVAGGNDVNEPMQIFLMLRLSAVGFSFSVRLLLDGCSTHSFNHRLNQEGGLTTRLENWTLG